ncbi:MAG: tetratricopeptide repeat protein [Bacteroidetes bacterium]|nr:tetratricopeptide repeat protein [Bacteroidota bacterium]
MSYSSFSKVCIVAITLFFSFTLSAQLSTEEMKSVDKSVELYQSQKYDKAIELIHPVIINHPNNEDLWTKLIVYENDRYETEFNRLLASLSKQINKGKSNIKLNDEKLNEYQNEMLAACLLATLYCERQELASNLLDRFLLMPSVDTAIGDEAKSKCDAGDQDYNGQDWSAAIRDYKKAVDIDSNYFNATYSLGVCYYKDEDFEKAATWFKKAIRIEPERTISYKSLSDTYLELKDYDNAKNACIDGIIIYPDVGFFLRLEKIADKMNKTFQRHWQLRLDFPNDITLNQDPVNDAPWKYYRDAKDKISNDCNEEGIIKHAAAGDPKYLETFSWDYMLKKSNPENESDYPEFKFARKMQDAGYLDCYVFVSMYHYNFAKQYKDFAKNNKDRIRTYINTYLFN